MIRKKDWIINFLRERNGYLKEGKERLYDILTRRGYNVTLDDCGEALKETRKENLLVIRESVNDAIPKDFELVSKWQGANGEWLSSYKKKKEETNEGWLVFRTSLLESLTEVKSPDNKYKNTSPKNKIAMEVSLPDLHFGKGDLKKLKKLYLDSVVKLVDKVPKDRIHKFILPIGNDGLNSEGKRQTTTAGTPQFDTGTWYETFVTYTSALTESIDYLNTIAPVDVIVVQGNHDWERMFYVGEMIKAYYSGSSSINVDNSPNPRKYYMYGQCLLMYTHGDKEKASEMPLIMATEKPLLFASSKHREVHCGHFHKEMLNEYRGVKVRFLPSICTTDDWHKEMGYEHYRCAQAYLWDHVTGLDGFVQQNV